MANRTVIACCAFACALVLAGCSGWSPRCVAVPDAYSCDALPAPEEVVVTPVGMRQVFGGVWLDILIAGEAERVRSLPQHYVVWLLTSLLYDEVPGVTVTSSGGGAISVKPGRTPGHVRFPTRKLAGSEPGVAVCVVGVPLRTTPRLGRGRYVIGLIDDGRFARAGIRLSAAEIELQYVSEIGEVFQRSPE